MSSLGIIITIIIVVSWVVRSLSAVTGNDADGNKSERKRRSLEEWDQLQARRRAEHGGQADELEELSADMSAIDVRQPPTRDLSQMTMAERIELARQRARQQSGGQGTDDAAEALRQARAEAEAQRRQSAEQQRRAQAQQAQRAQAQQARERQAAERRKAQAARERAEREAQQRRRRKSGGSKRSSSSQPAAVPPGPSQVRAESYKRVHHGHGHPSKGAAGQTQQGKVGAVTLGPLDAASLRRAFIMKELLDKPIALRNPQDDLLS